MVLFEDTGAIAVAAALAIGLSALATGWAEKDIGSAVIGAMAENDKIFGKGLIITVIPETIIIFGFLIAFLLLGKMA